MSSRSSESCSSGIDAGLILLSEDWRVVGMNEYVLRQITPAAAMMGENFFQCHPARSRDKVRSIVREISTPREGMPGTMIFDLLGRVFMVNLSRLSMLSAADHAASLALIFMDVTEQTGALMNPGSGHLELKKLPIFENGTFHFLSADDILVIEADGNYCRIFTRDRRFHLLMSLKTVLQRFPASDLLRVHKSYIVNLQRARNISPAPGGGLTVSFDHPGIPAVPVSRRQAPVLRRALS